MLSESALQKLGTVGRPRRLIFTVLGGYWEALGEWIRLRALVDLLEDLGMSTKAARAAIDRLVEQGMLDRDPRGSEAGVRLTRAMVTRIERRSRRIYSYREPASLDDGWLLVSYSIPESDRGRRHLIRAGLEQLGFASAGGGQWMAPAKLKSEVLELGRDLEMDSQMTLFAGQFEGPGRLTDLVARSWDLPALAAMYREFICDHRQDLTRLRQAPDADPKHAYQLYTLLLHSWRILPVLDPGLPAEVLPADWPGREAAKLFFDLRDLLYPIARCHVKERMGERRRTRS